MSATTTIREQIMQNRLAALQTLLYSDAHTDRPFKVVSRAEFSMFKPAQFPACYLYPDKETKSRDGDLYNCALKIVIALSVMLDNTNADALLCDLLRQVELAMLVDQSCGSLAQKCYELDNDFVTGSASIDGLPDRALLLVSWMVNYTHQAKDPTKTR